MYRLSEKKLLNSNTSPICPHNIVNFGSLTAEIRSEFGAPSKFQWVSRLGSVTVRHSNRGRQPNCGVEQTAPPVFGRAAITFGIGPQSSIIYFHRESHTDHVGTVAEWLLARRLTNW